MSEEHIRRAHGVVAVVAWTGVVITLVASFLGRFDYVEPLPHLYGANPRDATGAWPRLADTLSYFTVWSNIVVALSATLVALDPRRDTPVRRVLHLDALLMITITGIVYNTLLLPTDHLAGVSLVTSPLQHMITPVLVLLVWWRYGPRGWIDRRVVAWSMALPLAWVALMLGRGLVIDAYPYDFANVAVLGYPRVAATIAAILVLGLAIAAAFGALDRLLARRAAS